MVKKKEVLKRYSTKVGLALFEQDGSLPKVQTKFVFRSFDSSVVAVASILAL